MRAGEHASELVDAVRRAVLTVEGPGQGAEVFQTQGRSDLRDEVVAVPVEKVFESPCRVGGEVARGEQDRHAARHLLSGYAGQVVWTAGAEQQPAFGWPWPSPAP